MASIVRILSRPCARQSEIVDYLRDRILSNAMTPGSRIPTRSELEKRFRASSVTVQRALDRLTKDGFVCSKGRLGTFVSERPPHLGHYAVIFPRLPQQGRWSQAWAAFRDAAVSLQEKGSCRMSFFYAGSGPADNADYHELVSCIQAKRVAGLIFASHPYPLEGTPVLDEPGIPRVAIMSKAAVPGVVAVAHDQTGFMDRAMDYLKERGRRRVALVVPAFSGANSNEFCTRMSAGLAARGMETRRHWTQAVNLYAPEWAVNTMELLMCRTNADRPDGLIISDDHLVEHTTAGLVAAGVRVPEEMDVVAHCNYPLATHSAVPTKFLGYDARQTVPMCVRIIDRLRRGEPVPPLLTIPAYFDDEVKGEYEVSI